MKKCPIFLLVFALIASLANISTAFGDVPVSTPSSSSRNTTSGITGSGKYSSSQGGFEVSWSVTQNGANYQYIYNISSPSGGSLSQDLEYFILQVGTAITSSNLSTAITSSNTTIGAGPQTFNSSNFSGMPGSVYGIEFTLSSADPTIEFTSQYAPIWGSFYGDAGKSGSKSGWAYNTGFGTNPSGSVYANWLPTPGTTLGVATPEPTLIFILGAMLSMVMFYKARKVCKFSNLQGGTDGCRAKTSG